jgi:hypothetical protein
VTQGRVIPLPGAAVPQCFDCGAQYQGDVPQVCVVCGACMECGLKVGQFEELVDALMQVFRAAKRPVLGGEGYARREFRRVAKDATTRCYGCAT